MAQDGKYYWDSPERNKIIKKVTEDKESEFIGLKSRSFIPSKLISNRSLAAATLQNPVSVLNKTQQLECAKAYINNGAIRTIIDRTVYFIHGERTNFTIEPNEELTEGLDDEEARKVIDKFNNSESVKELRRKIIRVNKRCELHDRSTKLLTSALLFGRGALEIKRFPTTTEEKTEDGEKTTGKWPRFGEPKILKHLSSTRIVEAKVNDDSEFEGFVYEENNAIQPRRDISVKDLIPAFHDDNNVLDNSYYSGISAVWPILSVAQTIDAINDEDMPEAVRQVWAKFGIMYAGTSKKSTLRALKENLQSSTWLIHNEEGLKAEVQDMARDLMELPNVQQALFKYCCQSISLPLFLIFEDTANFATANQVMQVFKAGMLNRYRTWFRGVLEKHWYDPILADHLDIELKDVISADIKIKAVFPDINFETKKEIWEGDQIGANLGVLNKVDIAKDVSRPEIIPRLMDEMAQEVEQEELINDSIQRQREESIKGQQIGNRNAQKDGSQPRKQSQIPDQQ